MTYAVTVDVHLARGAQELDALQREGVIFLLRKGLDSIEAIEGPDGMQVDLTDDFIAVHPEGALLKLFVDAPALEFAEDAAREVVAELLERSELLADWEITRCEVDLHPDLLQESLDAADGPDAPPADPAERARRHAEFEPAVSPSRLDEAEIEEMRSRLRSLAPSLRAFPLSAFGHDEKGTVGREAAEVAAGALVHAVDLLVDQLFTDLAGLEEEGPTVAESDAPFMILDDLPSRFALQYTVLFARRLIVTAITMTGRLTQPHFGELSCVAEELLMKFLLAQAEVTADLHGLLTDEVSAALEIFTATVCEDLDHEWLYEPATDGLGVNDWFIPFNDDRQVHPYAANDGEDHA
ncbi:hypothetical protein [Streptomyces griseorubiginosus]|uniref:hypothetical protein n=1 Tax=Streptomyces griseorubiginosus TaxID=67304 RepID=UPI001AD76E44|nr:hypothetical protein [Streptomyces griseorubiginosus]MBO4256754.1 hypothetical protein [Streptomyces griseorubiginosus]